MTTSRLPDSPEKIARETNWLQQIAAGGPGREEAMRKLFDAYQPRFLASLRWHGVAMSIVEEVTQDAWMDIIRKADQFRVGATPSAWLWAFVRNARQDALRYWAHRAQREASDNDEAIAEEVEKSMSHLGVASPEASHVLDDMRRCVQRAFEAFKRSHGNEAWLLYVRHVEQWELEQIAECRQSSLHAATEFLGQARRKFRPLIEPCMELRVG